jgi:predicted Rossmann fold nucleotide-binding protein DprA/Smf involved in DNA uptake
MRKIAIAAPETIDCPASARLWLGEMAPTTLATLGDVGLLGTPAVALFRSVRCPGDVIVQTHDLARSLRDAGVPVIGGFQAPMEKECLEILLRGTQPVVVCLARSLDGMRVPVVWRAPMSSGRLLLVSGVQTGESRVTAELARERNRLVAALAETVLVLHAEPGGEAERLVETVPQWGKPVFTLASADNAALLSLGAVPITSDWAGVCQLRTLA